MSSQTLEHALDRLDELKTQFGERQARQISSLLSRITRLKVDGVDSLIRLHELLLFIRAYPHNPSVLKQTDAELREIPLRVSRLRDAEIDVTELEHPEVSGIAGTSVIDTFSYQIVGWLQQLRSSQIDFYWDWFEDENRLAEAWPRFMPLLEDDSFVEANVPYREWLHHARGGRPEIGWLLDRFRQLQLSENNKAELYNAQRLYVRWRFTYRDSRTGLRLAQRNPFYHDGPLIPRRDVNLKEELRKPLEPLVKLSGSQGHAAIDMARAASTIRYRELYGFTNGDPNSVYRTSLGRGVEVVVISLPPEKRLPLRAYHSAMIYKNGVPIGYFEGLSLFDRMESGFNLYYTFRDGETAWLYARTLNLMRKVTGVSAFALDPYQVGFENEEGIESGAFWFYRKLGFRSTSRSIQKLTELEEAKIALRKNYRTSAATLRRLARAPMIFELDKKTAGIWERFQIRNIGFAAQRLTAREFGGDANRIRSKASASIGEMLDLEKTQGIEDLAVALMLIGDLKTWSEADKDLLKRIIEAKATGTEARYLRLMQKHTRLREALIRIGNGSTVT